MSESNENIPNIAPTGWLERLQKNLDFDASFAELEGYDHYHTWTLRGVLCLYRNRFDECLSHLAQSSELSPGLDGDEEDRARYLLNWGTRFDAHRLLEIVSNDPESTRKTDDVAMRVASFPTLEGTTARRIQGKVVAFHHVLRGRLEDARNAYTKLIEDARKNPEFGVVSYMGAAAVSHELRLFKEARRHFENGELCMSFSTDRLSTVLYAAILKALCKHWDWENESERWSQTIDAIATNEKTRLCMHERARLLYVGVAEGVTATAL